jgi:hypothetical protein
MDNDQNPLQQRTTGDYLHTVAKAALSAIPFVGGPAAEMFALVLRLRLRNGVTFEPLYHSRNPFSVMELQDVQELTNFFERRVSAYQVAVTGEVAFHEEF